MPGAESIRVPSKSNSTASNFCRTNASFPGHAARVCKTYIFWGRRICTPFCPPRPHSAALLSTQAGRPISAPLEKCPDTIIQAGSFPENSFSVWILEHKFHRKKMLPSAFPTRAACVILILSGFAANCHSLAKGGVPWFGTSCATQRN